MVTGKTRQFRHDESGAAFLEFTAVIFVLLIVLFGVIEFSLAYGQWNAATKAMQVGARLASVSSPVWDQLDEIRGDEGSGNPGDTLNNNFGSSFAYKAVCDGSVSTTNCVVNPKPPGFPNIGNSFHLPSMNTLVFGRGSNTCDDGAAGGLGMCDIFAPITAQNVRITYQHSNLGYVTRPGGVVPTIKLELTGVFFQFLFLADLMGLGQIEIPGLLTTIPAEDLCSSAPNLPKWDNPC